MNLVLGAEDLLSDADISLYPNPADQRITIALKRPLNLSQTALIHDNTGKVVEFSYDTVEVLEIENGKVSVVRKYSE